MPLVSVTGAQRPCGNVVVVVGPVVVVDVRVVVFVVVDVFVVVEMLQTNRCEILKQ